MNLELKDCLIMGLKSKGFNLEFEAQADIDGGFECYMFSNGTYASIITGGIVRSRKEGGRAKMAYKHYYCQLGDDEYLKRFLESEGIMKNPSLLAGEYGGMFTGLIRKVMDYGTEDAELRISPLKNDDSIGDEDIGSHWPKGGNAYASYI